MASRKSSTPATASSESTAPKLTAQDIRRALAGLHGLGSATSSKMSEEWALFFELRNGTGYGRQERYVDAFAMNLYPSKKHWRVAYEIKVSRADFLKELKTPEKRDFAFEVSNEFWFAVAAGVAKPEEVPQDCGLLVVDAQGKAKRMVVAKQRQARDLSMTEVAALARSTCRYDLLSSKLWQYQGCELDDAALSHLVEARKDLAFRAELAQRTSREVEDATSQTRAQLGHYAEALRVAGVAPPPWMVRGAEDLTALGACGKWEAESWVRQHVSPGPNLQQVAEAMQALQRLRMDLERSTKGVTDSLERTRQGLQATDNLLRSL